jgi:hypothetical protein
MKRARQSTSAKAMADQCTRRCKGFLIRAGIVTLALIAVFVVMVNTGEQVPVSLAIERITEALGYAVADTLADV